jgi:Tfp pilus assembly protein PilP
MGQNDGRVTAVHEDRIDLVELVPDGAGGGWNALHPWRLKINDWGIGQ